MILNSYQDLEIHKIDFDKYVYWIDGVRSFNEEKGIKHALSIGLKVNVKEKAKKFKNKRL